MAFALLLSHLLFLPGSLVLGQNKASSKLFLVTSLLLFNGIPGLEEPTDILEEQCCGQKSVADVTYTLLGINKLKIDNCKTPCVYQKENQPGKMFCFAKGSWAAKCLDPLSPLPTESSTKPPSSTTTSKTTTRTTTTATDGGLSGFVNCLVNGGLQCVANKLPSVPGFLPAGPIRRGPYGGVCTCLSNIGGCYIDAAKPPGPGFTCTCIKLEGWVSGRHYGCSGVGYKLAWGEENTGGTDDLEQCRNGAKSITAQLSGSADCEGYMDAFSEQTWAKIQKDVKIRLFAPNSFQPVEEWAGSDGSCGVWEQGEDIYCKLQGGTWGDPQVRLPSGTSFNPRLPVKVIIHGFALDAITNTVAVTVYNKKYDGGVNTILVDWSPLGRAINLGDDTLDSNIYMRAARNAVIVGEYLGRCMAGLSDATSLRAENVHVIGHSLGGQMLGTLGPAYNWWMGHLTGQEQKIGRLTGLDPAGPGFVDGDIIADPRLTRARLDKSAGAAVDVIHTNAARSGPVVLNLRDPLKMRLGEYGPNGHIDFYPDGGDLQTGCNGRGLKDVLRLACSHMRSLYYFFDSIKYGREAEAGGQRCEFPVTGERVCMGDLAFETGKQGAFEVSTSAWYEKHRTTVAIDAEIMTRLACRAFSNVFTDYLDTSICTKDHSRQCHL